MTWHLRCRFLWICCLLVTNAVSAQALVDVYEGDYPLVLSAPHGGYLAPDSLKDRSCSACVTVRDTRTQEWARYLSEEIFLLTGRRPHLVISLLERIKLDPNREVGEAADGDPIAATVWAAYHAALDAAKGDVEARFGRGLVLDLHGHGHPVLRFELGYLLGGTALRESDSDLDQRAAQSSVRAQTEGGFRLSNLLRGPDSFGAWLDRSGVRATPSPQDPAPLSSQAFFSGGYITARHGSRDGGNVDAIQLEAYYSGARNSDSNVRALAVRVAAAVTGYMNTWYPDALGTGTDRTVGAGCASVFRSSGRFIRREVSGDKEVGCSSIGAWMFDVLGRRVARLLLREGEVTHLQDLPAGVYFIRPDDGLRAQPVVLLGN